MKCKYCGYETSSTAHYCEECGASLDEQHINLRKYDMPEMQDVTANQGYGNQQYGYGQNDYGNQKYGSGQQQGYGYQQDINGYSQYGNTYSFAKPYYNTNTYNTGSGSPKYVTFKEAMVLFFKNYADFSGRSTRSEFWYAILGIWAVSILVLSVLTVLIILTEFGVGLSIFVLGLLLFVFGAAMLLLIIPCLSLLVRRLHDTGRSGLFIFLAFIPYIGAILLFLFTVQESGPSNEYGPAPNPDYQYSSDHINML